MKLGSLSKRQDLAQPEIKCPIQELLGEILQEVRLCHQNIPFLALDFMGISR